MVKKHPEYQYLDLLQDILDNGSDKEVFFNAEVRKEYEKKGETPPFIRSVFGRQIRFDLTKGFPLLTTKKVFIRGIVEELLWFLSGSSNIKYLVDHNVHIWDEWAWKHYHMHCVKNDPENDLEQKDFIEKLKSLPESDPFVVKWGDLVTIYGRMWRRWPASDGREIDQLAWVIDGLKEKPFRKSYVVSAWNPDFIYAMASEKNKSQVPPFCHTTFQFSVTEGNKLNLGLYQRSADSFLGVPFNIASYALLLLMVAQVTGLKPGEFVHTFGDVHIYSNHFDAVKEQLSREPFTFPTVKLNPKIMDIDDFKFDDIEIVEYISHPSIKAEIANIGGFEEKKPVACADYTKGEDEKSSN
jgi:thymidylate synthase